MHQLQIKSSPICLIACLKSCTRPFINDITALNLFEQIVQQHPKTKPKYLAEYCFSGTYILTLLIDGYNFTSVSYSNIKFVQKVSRSQSTPFRPHTSELFEFRPFLAVKSQILSLNITLCPPLSLHIIPL